MRKWMKENMPGTWSFFLDMSRAMDNRPGGHSLRKWLAVGFYWLMWLLSIRFTTPENLTTVLGIHAGMITALIVTYSAANVAEKKITVKKEVDEQE